MSLIPLGVVVPDDKLGLGQRLPSRSSAPQPVVRAAPVRLHRSRHATRLHLAPCPCAPVPRVPDAWPRQAARLVTVLLVRPFVALFRVGTLLRLLRPLLTSRSGSSPSPFQAQGEISPGKNAILRHTVAASTPPDPWPQELRKVGPARPGRRRLVCGSCPSTHDLRSMLPSHARSPLRSCTSLASLWPARPGTCTPKIAPMLGAPQTHFARCARCVQSVGGKSDDVSRFARGP